MPDTDDQATATNLDFPLGLIDQFRASYAPDVVWEAPRRGLIWEGRDQVVANLLKEAAAMHKVSYTRLRRTSGDAQIIDEFVARFAYAGEGIQNLDVPAGTKVELQRIRILTLHERLVTQETAIETWSVLGR